MHKVGTFLPYSVLMTYRVSEGNNQRFVIELVYLTRHHLPNAVSMLHLISFSVRYVATPILLTEGSQSQVCPTPVACRDLNTLR